MIYVFLADGFEEIEAIAAIDVLRRAEYDVTTVAVNSDDLTIEGAHGMAFFTDSHEADVETDDMDAIILPGGMPGTLNLEKSPIVQAALEYCIRNDKLVAAICAAPSILGHKGYLKGKEATCYPGFEQELIGASVKDAAVVKDGTIITGRGPGVAVDFALKIVETISGKELAEKIGMAMQCPQA